MKSRPEVGSKVKIDDILGKYKIDIPGNGISQSGIDDIQRVLRNAGMLAIPEVIKLPDGTEQVWAWDWKVGGKGEYVGALPKRIGKYFWQTQGEKLPPSLLSEIGNIGSAHSGEHETYHFDIVDHVNWGQADFSQPDNCCYWSCHASAKDMILNNGGGAIRFFANDSYRRCYGFARAWLVPWKGCWIVFNGYGLETLAISRILATHLDHAYYRKIYLTNRGEGQGGLWINGGSDHQSFGYLVGAQQAVLMWSKIDLDWGNPEGFTCSAEGCDAQMDEEDHFRSPDGDVLCEDCYCDSCFSCECGEVAWNDDVRQDPDGDAACDCCWESNCVTCEKCGETIWLKDAVDADGSSFCSNCYQKAHAPCDGCGSDTPRGELQECGDWFYCADCIPNHSEEEEEEATLCNT